MSQSDILGRVSFGNDPVRVRFKVNLKTRTELNINNKVSLTLVGDVTTAVRVHSVSIVPLLATISF